MNYDARVWVRPRTTTRVELIRGYTGATSSTWRTFLSQIKAAFANAKLVGRTCAPTTTPRIRRDASSACSTSTCPSALLKIGPTRSTWSRCRNRTNNSGTVGHPWGTTPWRACFAQCASRRAWKNRVAFQIIRCGARQPPGFIKLHLMSSWLRRWRATGRTLFGSTRWRRTSSGPP